MSAPDMFLTCLACLCQKFSWWNFDKNNLAQFFETQYALNIHIHCIWQQC